MLNFSLLEEFDFLNLCVTKPVQYIIKIEFFPHFLIKQERHLN